MTKNLKFLFLSVAGTGLLAAALLVGTPGCTTTTVGTNTVTTLDTNIVDGVISATVPVAVMEICQRDSNAIPYFEQVSIVLQAAVNSGQFDPVALSNSVAKITVNGANQQVILMVEETVFHFYASFAAQVVNQQLSQTVWLTPVLSTLATSIAEGVPGTPAAARRLQRLRR